MDYSWKVYLATSNSLPTPPYVVLKLTFNLIMLNPKFHFALFYTLETKLCNFITLNENHQFDVGPLALYFQRNDHISNGDDRPSKEIVPHKLDHSSTLDNSYWHFYSLVNGTWSMFLVWAIVHNILEEDKNLS
jgi:hypothetical protein